jgi:Pyruvate/2-oxoacid:ferredoxin oxidoreductase delta subunit
MFVHYQALTRRYAEKILSGKHVFLKAFALLPLDILVAPIAIAYYLIGRFIIAKTFITNDKCDNCGLCISQCPTQSIVLADNRPYWKLTCESCMKCMNYCPKRAIETAHSFFFVLLFVLIIFVNPFLSEKVTMLVSGYMQGSGFVYKLLYYTTEWGIAILAYLAGYRLIHYLAKYRFFNRLITRTSFTYWKFWRRYRAPKELKIKN